MTGQQSFFVGALVAGFTVVIGAFGAHSLESVLEANGRVDTYQTAVQYQMYHALGLCIIGSLPALWQSKYAVWVAWLWVAGIIIFSGSLYTLSLTGMRWLGALAPIGGLCFIAGWALAALAARQATWPSEKQTPQSSD